VLSGILNAGYFAPIIFRAFLKTPNVPYEHREAAPAMVIPLVITAVLSLLLGLNPDLFFHFHRLAVAVSGSILGGIGQ
jgi:multicomponent Na+:H+ antiporter subunit D